MSKCHISSVIKNTEQCFCYIINLLCWFLIHTYFEALNLDLHQFATLINLNMKYCDTKCDGYSSELIDCCGYIPYFIPTLIWFLYNKKTMFIFQISKLKTPNTEWSVYISDCVSVWACFKFIQFHFSVFDS